MLKMSKMITPEGIREKYVINLIFFTFTIVRFVAK